MHHFDEKNVLSVGNTMQLAVKCAYPTVLPTGNSMRLPWNCSCLRSVPSGNTMQEPAISEI